ncbi:MAG TPA: phospholipase [Ktedonobacterales bacterium]|nr:phospholipase [Ktedonobacterales bacterium]
MTHEIQPPDDLQAAQQGRLLARPQTLGDHPVADLAPPSPGIHALGLAGADGRDGLLYVPSGYDSTHPAPLALLLHGAGGAARGGLDPLLPLADAAGMLLLAPNSRLLTWDIIMGGYGPDVAFIERALAHVFARFVVDATHLAIGGFSDGASYALSLGPTNGDLFTHIIAFSPGFKIRRELRGSPKVFISHGIHDAILPIDRCSRRIVRELRAAGDEIDYREFDGPHTVPPEIASAAVEWFTG